MLSHPFFGSKSQVLFSQTVKNKILVIYSLELRLKGRQIEVGK